MPCLLFVGRCVERCCSSVVVRCLSLFVARCLLIVVCSGFTVAFAVVGGAVCFACWYVFGY